MREIKFRGKRVDTGDWVYGVPIKVGTSNCVVICSCGNSIVNNNYATSQQSIEQVEIRKTEVYPETVGQYTGLKDKNTKEIYEGDMLSLKDETGRKGTVTVGFDDGGFIVFKGLAWRYIYDYDGEKNEMVVIGNIHDNPELLEERK